ncbi:MAG: peptide chain release factor N(5)-glutamine methyltransferase [Pyrinomonadaceae bacterium]
MSVAIKTALNQAARTLQANGISEPRLDAGLLMSYVIGRDRAFIVAHTDAVITEQELRRFEEFVGQRARGKPLQYITGHQEFFKLDFAVNSNVLIPRPESELIVEAVLDLIQRDTPLTFADIGTGSGCLAISILNEFHQAEAIGIDSSEQALQVAERNARRHGVADRLGLVQSDLFAAVPTNDLFDLIVSNPPYVPEQEMDRLQREVQWEPRSALVAGPDGLAVILRLIDDAPRYLRAGGKLVFEFGINQDQEVRELVDDEIWTELEIRKDLQGIPRTMILQKKR